MIGSILFKKISKLLGLLKVKNDEANAFKDCLTTYRSALFPYGVLSVLNDLTIERSHTFNRNVVNISFSIPFPCLVEHDEISAYVSAAFPELIINTRINTFIQPIYQHELEGIKNIIVISSGKGGVGKSTTTVNLAYALKAQGMQVGILDADVYGPSLPTMLGLEGKHPRSPDGVHLEPLMNNDIATMSTGFLADGADAKVWKGALASSAFEQMLKETLWGGVDYLLIDMPPGTGDIQLTLAQKIPAVASVIVTTPQDIALLDAVKGIAMFEKVNIPVLGIIENMSVHICEKCDEATPLFGDGGGENLAHVKGLPLFAQLPLDISIRESADSGTPLCEMKVKSKINDIYHSAASQIAAELYYQNDSRSPKNQ